LWTSELSPLRIAWHELPLTPFFGPCEVLNLNQWFQQVIQNVFQELPFADERRQPLPAFLKISYGLFHIGLADLSNKLFASVTTVTTAHRIVDRSLVLALPVLCKAVQIGNL
jgi:hypothetical protein